MKDKILFQEIQKFDQWWLWLLVLGLLLIPVSFLYDSESFVDQWTIDKIITSVLVVGILVLFLTTKMTTTITNEKIKVFFFPFLKREFFWDDIQQAQIIDYGFVGGWGIRIWTSYGTVYNVRGSKGLHFKIADMHYIIGTQKEQELRSKIAHLLK
ncbi:hypothetical protein [Nonlabens sp.]|uniref:hypothetical protein n=1 Tax=Nonlabens sp. TaxID=1888209 RepID=UPI0025D4F404|nr:hypothetical protein [Nonlabens sp.]